MAVQLATPVPISIAKALSVACVGGNGEPAHSAGSQAHGNCTAFGPSNAFEVGKVGGSSQIRFDQSQEEVLGSWSLVVCHQKKKPLGNLSSWTDNALMDGE